MYAHKLKKGDTIGVVNPSDRINDDDIPEIKESERLLIRVNHIIGRLASKGQLNRLQEKWHIK